MTRRRTPQRCHPHRYRTIRDATGRDLGGCCRLCGGLLSRGVDDDLLAACSLKLLLDEEAGNVELEARARARLQQTRRRLSRAERRRQEAPDA